MDGPVLLMTLLVCLVLMTLMDLPAQPAEEGEGNVNYTVGIKGIPVCVGNGIV